MAQEFDKESTMNEQNTMNSDCSQAAAANPERLMPTAEIIERNDFLTAKLSEMLSVEKPDYGAANVFSEEQYDIHTKYDFFDQVFEENGLKGIKDVKGNIRVPAIYTGFYQLYDHWGLFSLRMKRLPVCAYDKNGKCALVTTDGKGTQLTPFIYDAIKNEDLLDEFIVVQGKKKGVVDSCGNVLVPCEMDVVYEYFNSIRAFEAGGKFGLITSWGLYIAPIYDDMTEKDEYVYVRLGDTWGYIDYDGKFIDESDEETLDDSALLNYDPEF